MIFDMHNDFPTKLSETEYAEYIRSVGENKIIAVIWTTELRGDAVSEVRKIKSRLDGIKFGGKMPCAIEDIGFLADNERYKEFDFSQYAYCSLTWNYNNGFAGGAMDDGDLTALGKKVIAALDDGGCAVDLAHLNKKSFYSALNVARTVVCSHTGFNTHPRCLDAEMVRALIDRNAVIGLCTVSTFTDAHCAAGLAEVIDRFVQQYGDKNLAVGTDFNGSDDIPKDINDYVKLMRVSDILLGKGYGEQSVRKIFFENANNFFNRRDRKNL